VVARHAIRRGAELEQARHLPVRQRVVVDGAAQVGHPVAEHLEHGGGARQVVSDLLHQIVVAARDVGEAGEGGEGSA